MFYRFNISADMPFANRSVEIPTSHYDEPFSHIHVQVGCTTVIRNPAGMCAGPRKGIETDGNIAIIRHVQ